MNTLSLLFVGLSAVVWVVSGVPLTPEDFENSHTTVIDPNNPDDARFLQQHNVNITELQHQRALRANKSLSIQQTPLRSNSFFPTVNLDPSAAAANAQNPSPDIGLDRKQ